MENITYPDDYFNSWNEDDEMEKLAEDAYKEGEMRICGDGWTTERVLKEAKERWLRDNMPNGKCIERAIDGDLQNKKGKVAKDAKFYRWFLTVEMAEDFYAEVKNEKD